MYVCAAPSRETGPRSSVLGPLLPAPGNANILRMSSRRFSTFRVALSTSKMDESDNRQIIMVAVCTAGWVELVSDLLSRGYALQRGMYGKDAYRVAIECGHHAVRHSKIT